MADPGTGGLPPQRPDQVRSFATPGVQPGASTGRFRIVIIFGPGAALFVYDGTPGPGTLVASIAAPGVTSDPFGNTVDPVIASYDLVLSQAAVLTGSHLTFTGDGTVTEGFLALQKSSGASSSPFIFMTGPSNNSVTSQVIAAGQSADGTSGPSIRLSGLTLPGQVVTQTAVDVTGTLSVIGSASGQLAYIEQDGSAGHCLTLNLVGTGGTSQAALNAVSANSAFSCVEVTGVETGRGTVKIAHKGYADGSDANAAGLSIDLQTVTGGSTGTAAQGIFITSTTDSVPGGDAIDVRYGSLDWFVVKGDVGAGNGVAGIGVAIGHVPAGMLEIAQKDTTTPGLAMTAIAAGTDMVDLKDSGGAQRFQVNNAGNAIHRANAFFSTNAIIGSVSGDFGGAGSALTICHTTDPTTNPAAGHVILYVDAAGNLKARGSAGTVTTIATP